MTTRAHLAALATVPGVVVEGWRNDPDDAPLKFTYRLRVGDTTAYVCLFKTYHTKAGPWQLTARPYL